MSENAVSIGDANGLAVVRLLEAMRRHAPAARFVQASSREVFGVPQAVPQDEDTPRKPRNPYGAAKAYADCMIAIQREQHGLHASSAILFNHESERRSPEFVTRKVTLAAARIRHGRQASLVLENPDARRDWGFAGDFMRGVHAMAQIDEPRDFVFATGILHSVRELCDIAFARVGLDAREFVRAADADPRPAEASVMVGDATRARRELGWAPTVSFRQLIESMVDADMQRVAEEGTP
jgi:GDPmannose 4,6-dehydratase